MSAAARAEALALVLDLSRQIAAADGDRAIAMGAAWRAGASVREIAEITGLGRHVVRRIVDPAGRGR